MLDLDFVLTHKPEYRNNIVLDMNDGTLIFEGEKDIFSNIYGGLCGHNDGGVLIEESLQELLAISYIDLYESETTNLALLMFNSDIYSINIKNNKAGCSTEQDHLDFSTLKKLTSVTKSNLLADKFPHVKEDILLAAGSYLEDFDVSKITKEDMEELVNHVLDFDNYEYNDMIEQMLKFYYKI